MRDGVNDDDNQARRLGDIARRLHAHVNLIALNPTPGTDRAPSGGATMDRFVAVLTDLGVTTTVRDTRGQDIDAACGQLRARQRRPETEPGEGTSLKPRSRQRRQSASPRIRTLSETYLL